MNNNTPFYITTTLPYVNGKPHIGFALEVVQADVIARYERLTGKEVVFNVGTDEHGAKIFQEAQAHGLTPQTYCDEMAEHFKALKELLDVSYTHFIRTTGAQHIAAAQEFWKRCEANGDLYKKNYRMKYCVGCELEKTDSDLVEGKCPDHPNRKIEFVEEENYFFRFSKYREPLLALYRERPDFVVPEKRMNEIRAFVERGLNDFSVSRLVKKMPWGIPVPGDSDHVMYVWFDALVNYVSTLGWPSCAIASEGKPDHQCGVDSSEICTFSRFWPGVQIAGKDNLRQQAAMWQAMLLSAGLEPSQRILIHGHITSGGQKMSKSLGNVIAPEEMVERFGKDGTRYLLLSAAAFGEDIDLTLERMTEKYNADLANGLGNLVSRVLKLAESLPPGFSFRKNIDKTHERYPIIDFWEVAMNGIELDTALSKTWEVVRDVNKYIDETKPWELVKTDAPKFEEAMKKSLEDLVLLAYLLRPLLPETSERITYALETGTAKPLFQRIR